MALGMSARSSFAMLAFLNLVQLVLYIPLLALAGQGALYVLAGPKRDSNFFYRLLQLLSKPFTAVVRKLTPALVADTHVPVVTFFLVLIIYFIVTFERIDLCMHIGLEHCR
jgi:cytochrome b561